MTKQYGSLIGKSQAMETILQVMKKVAKTDAEVLVIGENGTGKELIVKEIHNLSRRVDEVFVSIDLGSITETLFESEMFRHVKGAFTDAKEDKTGWFETASGGTLFLDEIGNLSLTMQSKLLTAIQNRVIYKVGSKLPIPFDAQVEQILINLIKNSIEALNNNKNGTIHLTAFHGEAGIIIQVEDNGMGISDDIMGDIFMPFYTTKESGSGIGLSLSKQIMQNHYGTISANSSPRNGAIFTLKFVLSAPDGNMDD